MLNYIVVVYIVYKIKYCLKCIQSSRVKRWRQFSIREVKHQVYVKRQTRIFTTWSSFPFNCHLLYIICTLKLALSHNFLSIRIVFICFYLLIFYFEEFSTWFWRLNSSLLHDHAYPGNRVSEELFYVVTLKPSNSICDYNGKLVHIDTYKLYLSVRVFYCLTRPTNRRHFYLKINYCNKILRFITIAKGIISKFVSMVMPVLKIYKLIQDIGF